MNDVRNNADTVVSDPADDVEAVVAAKARALIEQVRVEQNSSSQQILESGSCADAFSVQPSSVTSETSVGVVRCSPQERVRKPSPRLSATLEEETEDEAWERRRGIEHEKSFDVARQHFSGATAVSYDDDVSPQRPSIETYGDYQQPVRSHIKAILQEAALNPYTCNQGSTKVQEGDACTNPPRATTPPVIPDAPLMPDSAEMPSSEREMQYGQEHSAHHSSDLLRPEDIQGGAWVGDDLKARSAFMELLAQQSLPMPQNEAQFHASRVYVDSLGCSVYSVEQWMDYLRVKGYSAPMQISQSSDTMAPSSSTIPGPRRLWRPSTPTSWRLRSPSLSSSPSSDGGSPDHSASTPRRRATSTTMERPSTALHGPASHNRQFGAMAGFAQSLSGSIVFMRQVLIFLLIPSSF